MKLLSMILASWVVSFDLATAAIKLPAIIGDHMVLQSGVDAPIWGTADPGEEVTVSGGAMSVKATADAAGAWKLLLPVPKESKPFDLSVSGKSGSITVHDVAAGDVWLCSGQSNMEWTLNNDSNGEAEIPAATNSDLRIFFVPKAVATQPQTDCAGHWELCTPESVRQFSAIAYYFGKEIAAHRKTTVGLIGSYVGGSQCEAWISDAPLHADASLKDYLADTEAHLAKQQKKKKKPLPESATSSLYNGMIAPLQPYALKGVVWYQGEGNIGTPYRSLLSDLIGDWRNGFHAHYLPFCVVQLPSFGDPWGINDSPIVLNEGPMPQLRQDQLEVSMKDPYVGLAVTFDLNDGTDWHPPDKQPYAKRIVASVLNKVYGEKNNGSGPVYDCIVVEGSKFSLSFKNVGDGLKAGPDGKVEGFALGGADGKFALAKGTITSPNTVTLTSAAIPAPTQVIYAWAWTPHGNLVNSAGIPASPFKLDEEIPKASP